MQKLGNPYLATSASNLTQPILLSVVVIKEGLEVCEVMICGKANELEILKGPKELY